MRYAFRDAEVRAQHVAAAIEIAQRAVQREPCLAQAGRELVVERGADVVARRLGDARLEHGLARPLAGHELGVDARHQRVAQPDLQPLLELPHVQRRPGVQLDAVAEVLLAKVLGALDLDAHEAALDDADLDHAVRDALVGDHRAGIDVAALDVEQRELAAQLLQLGATQLPVLEGRSDLCQLGVADRRVAGDAELAHRDAQAERHAPGVGRLDRRQLQQLGRGLPEFRHRQRLLSGARLRGQRRRDLRPRGVTRAGGEQTSGYSSSNQ